MATNDRQQVQDPHKEAKQQLKELLFLAALLVAVLVTVLLASCERRELYVYGDEFHSVELEVDWRQYVDTDPDGMTVWFYPLDDPAHAPYRSTTANVRRHGIYLPSGHYTGIVIDYSPNEYSRQQFLDMDSLTGARVEAVPALWQPDSLTVAGEGVPAGLNDEVNRVLFGESAWTALMADRPPLRDSTGLYTVASQPERMGLDTLVNRYVDGGIYGDYIPWRERETYQSSLKVTTLYAEPLPIVWTLHVRIWIRSGFNYLWQTPASVTGLADGHYLPLDVNTARPCLHSIDGWDYVRTGDNTGYIETSISTFGLCSTFTGDPADLRLNVQFVLRDHATVVGRCFDVGDCVEIYERRLLLDLELDQVNLPYVDAYNGAGFDAEVTPWEEEPPIDITF